MLYFKECGINAAKILSAYCLDFLILALFIMFHLHGVFRQFLYQQGQQMPLCSQRPCSHWDTDDTSLCDFCMDTFTELGPVI